MHYLIGNMTITSNTNFNNISASTNLVKMFKFYDDN